MPQTLPGDTAVQPPLTVIEEGTTLVEEVRDSLAEYDGGTMPIGVCAVRNIAGTNTPSQHSWCNAVDFMCSGELHRQVAFFIDANRGPLAIHWLGADPYFPSPLGDHYNHVHADFYPQGPF